MGNSYIIAVGFNCSNTAFDEINARFQEEEYLDSDHYVIATIPDGCVYSEEGGWICIPFWSVFNGRGGANKPISLENLDKVRKLLLDLQAEYKIESPLKIAWFREDIIEVHPTPENKIPLILSIPVSPDADLSSARVQANFATLKFNQTSSLKPDFFTKTQIEAFKDFFSHSQAIEHVLVGTIGDMALFLQKRASSIKQKTLKKKKLKKRNSSNKQKQSAIQLNVLIAVIFNTGMLLEDFKVKIKEMQEVGNKIQLCFDGAKEPTMILFEYDY